MKTLLLLCTILFSTVVAHTQKIDSSYYEAPPAVVPYLKPITVEAGRYYYGNKKLSAGGAGFVLEVPFAELNDTDVNKRFTNYKTARVVGQVMAFLPLIYFISRGSRGFTPNEFWTIYGLSIGGSIGSDLIGKAQLRKGIERYNLRVERNKIGLSTQPLPNQSVAFGLGFSRSF